jgi:hypothetical protein
MREEKGGRGERKHEWERGRKGWVGREFGERANDLDAPTMSPPPRCRLPDPILSIPMHPADRTSPDRAAYQLSITPTPYEAYKLSAKPTP